MKLLTRFAVLGFLWMSVGLGFSQSAAKSQTAPAKPQVKAEKDEEEAIPPANPNDLFPAIVAKVNGKAILGRDLERAVRGDLAPLGNPEWKNLREDYRGELVSKSLTMLINQNLLYQKATAIGIKTTDAEVQAEMQRITKQFKSDAEMNATLANWFTDRISLEKSLYQTLTVSKFIEENINKKTEVAPEEVAKYYTSHPAEFQHPDIVRTSHILIPAGDTLEQDTLARQRAEALLARAKKGEDFAKLAKSYSTDASASQGGDVGFSPKQGLIPEYAEAAFSLPVGGVTLVKTQLGYHIIKVTDKKKEGLSTLEEVRQRLTEFLKKEKSQADLTKLISQLRDQAKIEILIPTGQPLGR